MSNKYLGTYTCYIYNSITTVMTNDTTHFAFFSSIIGGLVRCALSPIRVAMSILPVSGSTSPVASSRGRRSINERSAWSTRLEFYNVKRTAQSHLMQHAARQQILLNVDLGLICIYCCSICHISSYHSKWVLTLPQQTVLYKNNLYQHHHTNMQHTPSFDWPYSLSQTASGSYQPFCHSTRTSAFYQSANCTHHSISHKRILRITGIR